MCFLQLGVCLFLVIRTTESLGLLLVFEIFQDFLFDITAGAVITI